MSENLSILLQECAAENFFKNFKKWDMRNFEFGFVLEFDDDYPMFIGKKLGVSSHYNLGSLILLNQKEQDFWSNLSDTDKNNKITNFVYLMTRNSCKVNIVPSVENLKSIDIDKKIPLQNIDYIFLGERILLIKQSIQQLISILHS